MILGMILYLLISVGTFVGARIAKWGPVDECILFGLAWPVALVAFVILSIDGCRESWSKKKKEKPLFVASGQRVWIIHLSTGGFLHGEVRSGNDSRHVSVIAENSVLDIPVGTKGPVWKTKEYLVTQDGPFEELVDLAIKYLKGPEISRFLSNIINETQRK